jgi:hypothetical protein
MSVPRLISSAVARPHEGRYGDRPLPLAAPGVVRPHRRLGRANDLDLSRDTSAQMATYFALAGEAR